MPYLGLSVSNPCEKWWDLGLPVSNPCEKVGDARTPMYPGDSMPGLIKVAAEGKALLRSPWYNAPEVTAYSRHHQGETPVSSCCMCPSGGIALSWSTSPWVLRRDPPPSQETSRGPSVAGSWSQQTSCPAHLRTSCFLSASLPLLTPSASAKMSQVFWDE